MGLDLKDCDNYNVYKCDMVEIVLAGLSCPTTKCFISEIAFIDFDNSNKSGKLHSNSFAIYCNLS